MNKDIIDLFAELEKKNIHISLENGKLKVDAPKGGISKELREQLKDAKESIIAFLEETQIIYSEIKPAETAGRYLISPSQKRMWTISSLHEQSAAYNLFSAFRIKGNLNIPAFKSAIHALITRHEILRTVFEHDNEDVYQRVIPIEKCNEDCTVEDYRDVENKTILLDKRLSELANMSLDLVNGPLFRWTLLKIENEQWVFAFVMHHIISDGWSMKVILDDILKEYTNTENNDLASLPLKIQHKDCASWMLLQSENEKGKQNEAYWKEKLSTAPILNFPTDYVRNRLKTYNGNSYSYTFPLTISEELIQYCGKNGGTVFMGLLTGVYGLIYRYTNERSIVIGTTDSGRHHPDLFDQVGFFINVLPLYTKLDPSKGFNALFASVKETMIEAQEHLNYPFEKIVEGLDREMDVSRSPVFDIMVTIQDTNDPESTKEQLGGLQIESIDFDFKGSKYDITFSFQKENNEIHLTIEYNTDLFQEKTISSLAGHLANWLNEGLKDPLQPVAGISCLQVNERSELLKKLDYTNASYPEKSNIISLIEQMAEKNPDALALRYKGSSLTYQQLIKRANVLAAVLQRRYNVEKGDYVCLRIKRTERIITSILAVLKCGACYVPVDPDYPEERVSFINKDTTAKLQIDDDFINAFESENYTETLLSVDIEPDTAAYVIYTSGTSGLPKGVIVSHRNVVRLIKNDSSLFDFKPTDKWVLFHSFCFDFSVWEIFGPLITGGSLVIADLDEVRDPQLFTKLLVEEKVTVVNQTPSAFYRLSEEMKNHNVSGTSIRYVIFGGEALHPGRLEWWHKKFPESRLINMYGITETTVHVTYKRITQDDIDNGCSNLGTPLPTLKCYLLDGDMQPVPFGIPGEIFVGGLGVSSGYLNRAELNKKYFIDDPFVPGQRLYKTGDMARLTVGGEMEYIGRKDDQLKVRGFRIEPGEIEAALIKHNDVKEAIAFAHKDGNEDELIAVVVPASSHTIINEVALRTHLLDLIPIHAIPNRILVIDRIPLTVNGKADRRKLMTIAANTVKDKIVEIPIGETEQLLASIWSDVLHLACTGRNDNFFAMGGDSIKAIQMAHRIGNAFGCRTEVKDIYFYPVLSELAGVLDQRKIEQCKNDKRKEVVLSEMKELYNQAISKITLLKNKTLYVEDVFHISDIELGMLYHNLVGGGQSLYHDQMFFRIQMPAFSIERFSAAMDLMTQRHEILRTSYHLDLLETPVRIIHRSVDVKAKISQQDLRGLPKDKITEQLNEVAAMDRELGIKADTAGLWRIYLFRLSDNEYTMLWVCHHAILDGWSNAVLLTELTNTYLYLEKDSAYSFTKMQSSYKDYIIEQQLFKNSLEIRNFWMNELDEAPRTLFPFKKATNVKPGTQFSYNYTFEPNLISAIEKFSEKENVSLKIIFLASFIHLLHLSTNSKDIVHGLVTNGRPAVKDGDRMLGCFLNTIPLRFQYKKGVYSWKELLRKVKEKYISLKAYEGMSLMNIASTVNPQSAGKENPFFDMYFNYTDFHVVSELKTDLVETNDNADGNIVTNTLFDFIIDKNERDIRLNLLYHSGLYQKKEISRIVTYYANILKAMVEEPESLIDNLKLIPYQEQELLSGFNKTEREIQGSMLMVDLFESEMLNTPEKIAVTYKDSSLTYSALNGLANALAIQLANEYRVGKGDIVVVSLERSERLIVAFLAIQKTGAAYLPVPIDLPDERKNYIISNSNAKVVILDEREETSPRIIHSSKLNLGQLPDGKDEYKMQNRPSHSDPAFVIYTSGTTGMPKGVVQHHGCLLNLVRWQTSDIGRDHNVLQFTYMGADVSLQDIAYSLVSGGTLHIIEESKKRDVPFLAQFLIRHKINMLCVQPGVINLLFEHEQDRLKNHHHLKHIISTGEQLKVSNGLRQFISDNPEVRLHNHYGPSETHVVTRYKNNNPDGLPEIPPIGAPIDNTKIYVLDDNLQLLPFGVYGDIYLSGMNVALGYLNQPELTAARFLHDPFNFESMMYLSGDIGSWEFDGSLDFIGRIDDQVKIRGFRVELKEVEKCFLSFDGIKEAVVVARKDKEHSTYLSAYVCSDNKYDAKEFRGMLAKHLPDYMIPANITLLDKIPLTKNSKIDFRALPDPIVDSHLEKRELKMPQNEMEAGIKEVWQNMLGRKDICMDDNFFEIGGDSIKLVKLFYGLQAKYGLNFEMADLFRYNTVLLQATALNSLSKNETSESNEVYNEIKI